MAKIISKAFQLRKQLELREGRRVPLVEVAEKAGVSKPTSKKYLEAFYEEGHMSRMKIGNMFYYRKLVKLEE